LAYHDIVYLPGSKNNEKNSIQSMIHNLSILGVEEDAIKSVSYLIKVTNHFDECPKPPKVNSILSKTAISTDGELVKDIDLLILAEDPATYLEYEAGIYREYSYIPQNEYIDGRIKVLKMFLKKPCIYHHYKIRDLGFDQKAKKNLTRAIDFWKSFK
jgi:predicted metal-dependent HD superfamily phosphohydrolase